MPSSIDAFIPTPDVDERHEALVRAPANVVFDVAEHFDMMTIPLVRWIFNTRARVMHAEAPHFVGSKGLIADMRAIGWGVLAHRPGHEWVMGAVTKPWEPGNVVFTAVEPDRFARFDSPGFVKIAWTIEAEPLEGGRSRLRTQTRVVATDDGARRLFRRYWRTFSIGIVLIRRLLVGEMRRQAERRYRGKGV